ncbi:hypothetical protein HYR99_24445 [Candidatus Poribacteria bacterium]|nr:hypothetical protein [Candidatus Poribacteria bacterium]
MLWTKQQQRSHQGKYRIFTVLMAKPGTDLQEYREKLSRWLSMLATCPSCLEIEILEHQDFKGCYAYTEVWEDPMKWQQEVKAKFQDKAFQDLNSYIFSHAGRDIGANLRGFYVLEELKKEVKNK